MSNPKTTEPRTRITRADFGDEVKSADYRFYVFEDANGKNTCFTNCNFSYCYIESSYFHSAKFLNCKFIGAKIVDSNFRSCTFVGCDFKYATFTKTNVSVKEILNNLPSWPNVRCELLQSLRINAQETGDTKNVSLIVKEEIKSDREHWRLARKKADTYYSQKYSGFRKRCRVYYESIKIWISDFLWGYGEFPSKLFRSVLLALLIFSIWIFFLNSKNIFLGNSVQLYDLKNLALNSIVATVNAFLDLNINDQLSKNFYWLFVMSLFRYLSLGLFINILMKKFSRR